MKNMDVHIKKVHAYENLMYKTDDELIDYIQELSLKHA
jgi:hypothetical protein